MHEKGEDEFDLDLLIQDIYQLFEDISQKTEEMFLTARDFSPE